MSVSARNGKLMMAHRSMPQGEMVAVGTSLRFFPEVVLGTRVHVFGNVAVVIAGCEITEKEENVNRGDRKSPTG